MIQIIAARSTNCLAFACIYIELKTIKSTTFPTKILSPNMDAYCRGITRSSCKPVFGAQELCHSCASVREDGFGFDSGLTRTNLNGSDFYIIVPLVETLFNLF